MRLWTASFLIAALAAGPAFAQKPGGGPQGPTPVIVARVIQDDFVDRGEALGTLKARESVVLTSTVTEAVTAINFEDGQRVAAGDVLVEMTSAEEGALLQEERSTVNEAWKQVERLEPLVKQGAASKSLLDQRRREYETARARLKAVESRMDDRLVKAPFAGVLGLRNTSIGALLQPGTMITTLHDDSVMKLDFTVPSVFLPELHVGLPIKASARAYGDKVFDGEVSAVDSQVDPVTRSITVRALIPNPDGVLKPGLLMKVDLLKNRRQAIVVPEEAIITEGTGNSVFVIEGEQGQQKAVKRAVKTAARRPGDIEITEGLSAGELVVTHGTFKLSEGAAVTVTAVEEGTEELPALLEQKKQEQPAETPKAEGE